jgi:acetyl esterase
MPLDPVAAGLLQQITDAGMPPLNEMSPSDARVAAQAFADLAGEGDPVGSAEDRTIPGPHGDIPVRVYTPNGGTAPRPVLVYIHGGGWVIGDIPTTDAICRDVANRAECVVVSVDYRLSPEHKFPIPLNDCFAAVKWVADNAASLGADPGRVAVGGDSAGGNLSAAIALRARDEGGPALTYQLLVYPVTNYSFDTESYDVNGKDYLLTRDMMEWFWDHYVNSAADGDDPLASPLRAKDLSGLPPATVFTAEFDPLRDEGEAYAARLTDAGVAVKHKRFEGQIHAFWQMPGLFPAALQAADIAAADLKAAFGTA